MKSCYDDELLAACKAAFAALEHVERYYLTSSSAAAEMWAFVNGYEGSPDIRAIVEQAEAANADES